MSAHRATTPYKHPWIFDSQLVLLSVTFQPPCSSPYFPKESASGSQPPATGHHCPLSFQQLDIHVAEPPVRGLSLPNDHFLLPSPPLPSYTLDPITYVNLPRAPRIWFITALYGLLLRDRSLSSRRP